MDERLSQKQPTVKAATPLLPRVTTAGRMARVSGTATSLKAGSKGGNHWAGILRAARPCNGGSKGAISPLWRGDVAQQCITSPFSLFSPAPDFSAALPVA